MGYSEIIKRNGEKILLNSREPFCAVKSAVQNCSLMGDDNIHLSIVSSEMMSFEKGDKILVNGNEYSLRTKPTREMLSDSHYVFDLVFYGVMFDLMKSLYRNTDSQGKSTTSTFDLTYSIRDFVHVLIYNLNRDYPGVWLFDEENCPETDPQTIQFSNQNCLQVLQTLCSEDHFNLEFRITQDKGVRTIHIGKFGEVINPPAGNAFFEWGKGGGLFKLKEQKVDDKAVITRLWVEGGVENLRTEYREYSDRLQLPLRRKNKNRHTLSDGTVIEPGSEMIGIPDESKRYIEDADLRDTIGSDEDGIQYDQISPKRTGTVTALVDGDINSFIDETMDFDLCEKDKNGTKYLINDVSAKITFISGKLAGQQFELSAKKGYDHSKKQFVILPFTDERGLKIPTEANEAYRIGVGDQYKITDINLPDSYIDDAEEELWYKGYDDFLRMKQPRAQYSLDLYRLYFIQSISDDNDICVFNVGDYVPIKDSRFGIEKRIRIQKVTRNLMMDHDYKLTLSDVTAISVQNKTIIDVIEHDRIIDNNRLRDPNKARRGWRTTEDLRNMVYDPDGFFDAENIRPNSIDTNMLTVGAKSQQFILVDVVLEANVGGEPNQFSATGGKLLHLTIDEKNIKEWNLTSADFTLSDNKGYYLYAKCSKTGNTGVWFMSQEQKKFETTDDPNNYYFQVGIVSSLKEGDTFRDFVTTYGFTRINGNTITTGRIVTSDGECYLDLDGNKFRIGDANSSVDWNVTAKNQTTLNNVTVVSKSGESSKLGVYLGLWDPKRKYYNGDECSYSVDGTMSIYRYTYKDPTIGHPPTDTTYWDPMVSGQRGENGKSTVSVYRSAKEKPDTPTGTTIPPTDWSLVPVRNENEYTWMSQAEVSGDGAVGTWSDPIRITGADGINGKDGKDIEFIYKVTDAETDLKEPPVSEQKDDAVPTGWTDNPTGVTPELPKEWVCVREKVDGTWGTYSKPAIWSKWGEKGMDGDGYEYIYKRTAINIELKDAPVSEQKDDAVPDGWTDDPTGVSPEFPKEWVCVRRKRNGTWGVFSTPAIWAKWSIDGSNGKSVVYIYRSSEKNPGTPTENSVPPTNWSLVPVRNDGEYTWMSQAIIDKDGFLGNWSYPIRITGDKGDPGADGKDIEFIYRLTDAQTNLDTAPVSVQQDDYVPDYWTDNPKGVSSAFPKEWICVREKKDGTWGTFSTPAIWSKWGENGMDGDGYEYIYKLTDGGTTLKDPPVSEQKDDAVPAGWTDDPTGVSAEFPLEWVCVRRKRNGTWGPFSTPAIWSKWGKDGSSPVIFDADNEMIAVAVDRDGKAIPGQEWSVRFDCYVGSKAEIVKIESYTVNTAISEKGIFGNNPTKFYPLDSYVWSKGSVINQEVGLSGGGTKGTVVVSFYPVFPGEKGDSPVIYSLNPSHSALKFNRDESDNIVGSHDFSFTILEKTGTSVTEHTTEPGPLYTYWALDGSTFTRFRYNSLTKTITADDAKTYSELTIELWRKPRGTTGSQILDRETIPFVIDGIKGDPGPKGVEGVFTSKVEYSAADCKTYCTRNGNVQWLDAEIVESKDNADNRWSGTIMLIILCTNGNKYVSYQKVVSRTALFPLSYYISEKGKDGEGFYRIDADNEMIAVACNNSGNRESDQRWNITLRAFQGASEITQDVKFSVISKDPDIITRIDNGNVLYVELNPCEFQRNDKKYITLNGEHGTYGGSVAVITLFPVFPGRNGEDPIIFQVNPYPNALHFSRDSYGNLIGGQTLNVKVTKTIGKQTEDITSNMALYNLDVTICFDGYGGQNFDVSQGLYIDSREAGNYNYVGIELSQEGTVLDREAVPIVKDGANGLPGDPGESGPALVFRGEYSSTATYYGNAIRQDCVKVPKQNKWMKAKRTAGVFSNKPTSNTAYWEDFGLNFESIATGLLLAEGANIANFIFRNQRMESQGKTLNVPNIILDGLKNIAQFAAGQVKFENDKAFIGWLQVVKNDLIGYAMEGGERVEKVKITSGLLPSENSLGVWDKLHLDSQPVLPNTEMDYSREEYGEVNGYRYGVYSSDRETGDVYEDDQDMAMDINFSINRQSVVDWELRPGLQVTSGRAPYLSSFTVVFKKNGTVVSTTHNDSGRITLEPGDYTVRATAVWVQDGDWTGKISISGRMGYTVYDSKTILASDGLMSTFGGNFFRYNKDDFRVKFGNYILSVSSSGVRKSSNGGSTWTNL